MSIFRFLLKCKVNILKVLLIVSVFFIFNDKIFAKEILKEDVINEFKNASGIKALEDWLGDDFSYTIDDTNKKIDFYVANEKRLSFNYNNEYIEYDNQDISISDLTEDEMANSFIAFIIANDFLDTVLKLSGYENYKVSEQLDLIKDFETYGIKCLSDNYVNMGNEDGISWEVKITVMTYFKISLDTSKIDTLVSKYGVIDDSIDETEDIFLNLTPILIAEDITSDSVSLYPYVNLFDGNSIDELNCYVYRSTEEDGEYERVQDFSVNCLDKGIGIIDSGLEPDKDYYYKAVVVDGKSYSSPLKIRTKPVNVPAKEEFIENPKTGVASYFVCGFCMFMVGTFTILFLRRKNSLNRL